MTDSAYRILASQNSHRSGTYIDASIISVAPAIFSPPPLRGPIAHWGDMAQVENQR